MIIEQPKQAQAVVDDWCQEVEWFGDGTDALVRLIAAALDAADRAAYIRGQESMTVASENDRADLRTVLDALKEAQEALRTVECGDRAYCGVEYTCINCSARKVAG